MVYSFLVLFFLKAKVFSLSSPSEESFSISMLFATDQSFSNIWLIGIVILNFKLAVTFDSPSVIYIAD